MKLIKFAAVLVVAAIVGSAIAQGGGGQRRQRGGGGGNPYAPLSLVGRAEVQTELNITDDEKAKITDLQTSTRSKSQEAYQAAGTDRAARAEATKKINEEANKALVAILTPEQAKRLREIQIQWTGISIIIADTDVQTSLGLSDDQKAKITDLKTKADAANAELQAKSRSQEIDRQQATELRRKNQTVLEEELGKVLTDAQKTKLTELGGKHLDKPAARQRGGGN